MNIVVYTKSACPLCVSSKQLLASKGLEYIEKNVEDPVLWLELLSLYPEARQLPQIWIDGQRVGGLAGLKVALNQMELL